jgi:hypothetical protein
MNNKTIKKSKKKKKKNKSTTYRVLKQQRQAPLGLSMKGRREK